MKGKFVCGVILGAACCSPALGAEPVYQIPEVVVVGVTPLMGSGVDIDKVPGNVQVVTPAQQRNEAPGSVAEMLDHRLGSISSADYQGNPLQPNLSFRGFNASPVLGDPQGIAVYQNGMRLNEAFGDLVNWDMNPSFAVESIQVLPGSNPVFGLNAQGGAVALKMKDGLTTHGSTVELGGGSFGRMRTTVETGRQFGNMGFYTGISAENDDGWRQSSPSKLMKSYTDLAANKGPLTVGLGVTLGASDLSGLGTSPVQLLQQSRNAVFSSPDTTQNALMAAELRGSYDLSNSLSVQGNAYYRHLRSATHNGDANGAADCGNGTLCDQDGNPLTSRSGAAIAATGQNGAINNTTTLTDSMGVAGQVSHDGQVLNRQNVLNAGISTDQGWTRYTTNSELGTLSPDRAVIGSGLYLGGSDYNVSLNTRNAYYGAYLTDTYSLTPHLHWTASGRFNIAEVDLTDRLGAGLNGDHNYQRFNPSTGLTWQLTDGLTTYASYGEANRVPTAAELACADPTKPCRVPNAFQSDPNLSQVVSRTMEVGARGKLGLNDSSKLNWSLAAYNTRNQDDIIFVSAGPVVGSGYFANAGNTLRQGIEANLDTTLGKWSLYANYGLVRAVFDSNMTILSPFNSAANTNGEIQVQRGAAMPGIPQHSLKLGADYAFTERLSAGGDAQMSSSRRLRGDESNTMSKIPGFAVFNANAAYKFSGSGEVFLRVKNLLDQKYATAGTLGDPTTVFPNYTDNRFETPGEPRSFWAGVRMGF
jgi:outer membrane receptor protein involved in Fe transport